MLPADFLENYEAELGFIVLQTLEPFMGIADLKEQHKTIPGIDKLAMHYGEGGKTEIYVMGDVKVELPSGSTADKIGQALLQATSPALARVDDAVAAIKKKLAMDQAA